MELPDKQEVIDALNNAELMGAVFERTLADPAVEEILQKESARYVSNIIQTNAKVAEIVVRNAYAHGLMAAIKM